MTTCAFCLGKMAARSQKQLDTRLRNIEGMPDVMLSACPRCGGTEWATTTQMIEKPKQSLLSWLFGLR
jgi:hypothetical protein